MIGIIADDLTGASDSGVQLARQGYNTCVVFHLDHLQMEAGADVVVMDTDSRALPAEQAYSRVKQAAEKLKSIGLTHLFKKLDSTLRGNLGKEIEAVLDVCSFDFAIVAPAFPKIGRTTMDAVHYLHGVPVHQTEIAKDPKCPVVESNLVKLLTEQTGKKVGHVPLAKLHEGAVALGQLLAEFKNQGIQILVFDALETEDLQKIVQYSKDCAYQFLWVGSAGLAESIPLLLPNTAKRELGFKIPLPTLPVMLVAGSLSQITKEQVERFNSEPTVLAIEFDPVAVMDDESWTREKERCRQQLLYAAQQQKDISLFVGTSPRQLEETKNPAFREKWGAFEVSRRIAVTLGELAAELLRTVRLQGVIMTGGDTAKAICECMFVSGLQLLDEVEDGIPVSRLLGKEELLAVTKAGAFGNVDSLVHALHILKGEGR
jgi:D-threonate/D-erythronate kinase